MFLYKIKAKKLKKTGLFLNNQIFFRNKRSDNVLEILVLVILAFKWKKIITLKEQVKITNSKVKTNLALNGTFFKTNCPF